MITDRFTAKILGAVLVVFALLIDVSFFMFSTSEARGKPGFALVVLLPSLPFIVYGLYLFRRADRMKADD